MPKNLRRVTGLGDLHFITFCNNQRRSFLATPGARNLAVQILGEVRDKYGFALVGYVFMPQHVHLLVGEIETRLAGYRDAAIQAARVATNAARKT